VVLLILAWVSACWGPAVVARDLDEIRQHGVLRHLGVRYANFVTGSGDGLDVELIQGFARHLGVRYEFVESDWTRVLDELIGYDTRQRDRTTEHPAVVPVGGDLVANGLTVLEHPRQMVAYSAPTFPSGIWLVAGAASPLRPISPSGALESDIRATKVLLDGVSLLATANGCLDPQLYRLDETGAEIRLTPPERKPDEMVPAMLKREAETTLLDIPDGVIALERLPGQVKVLGRVSATQPVAVAFHPESPKLRAAFDSYLATVRADGSYDRLVRKYYPAVVEFFRAFFNHAAAC